MFEHSVSTLSSYPPRSYCQPILFEFNLFCLDSIRFLGKRRSARNKEEYRTKSTQALTSAVCSKGKKKKKDLNMSLLKVRHNHILKISNEKSSPLQTASLSSALSVCSLSFSTARFVKFCLSMYSCRNQFLFPLPPVPANF